MERVHKKSPEGSGEEGKKQSIRAVTDADTIMILNDFGKL